MIDIEHRILIDVESVYTEINNAWWLSVSRPHAIFRPAVTIFKRAVYVGRRGIKRSELENKN